MSMPTATDNRVKWWLERVKTEADDALRAHNTGVRMLLLQHLGNIAEALADVCNTIASADVPVASGEDVAKAQQNARDLTSAEDIALNLRNALHDIAARQDS